MHESACSIREEKKTPRVFHSPSHFVTDIAFVIYFVTTDKLSRQTILYAHTVQSEEVGAVAKFTVSIKSCCHLKNLCFVYYTVATIMFDKFLQHAYLLKHFRLPVRRNLFCILPYLGIMSRCLEQLWILRYHAQAS